MNIIGAVLLALMLSAVGYAGYKAGYSNGFSEGVAVLKGDKWDCAYSDVTGFLMCDRTPKYK